MAEEISFTEVLDRLFGDKKPPVSLLYKLSDLTADDYSHFKERWAAAPAERRRMIARHLADISEDNFVVDFSLIFGHCLMDDEPAVRLAALDGLWDSPNAGLVQPLIGVLQTDENILVRAAAAKALSHYILMAEWGELPKEASLPVVEAFVGQYEAAGTALPVRRAVLEGLGTADDPRVAGLIARAYDTDDDELQLSAVFAMGLSADGRWLPTIRHELASPIVEMRAEAARAAGEIGSSDLVDELGDMATDFGEDLDARRAAVTSLGQIGGDMAYAVLQRLADDPTAEALYDAVDEALEEMEWLGGNVDRLLLNVEEDELWDDDHGIRA